MTEFTLLLRKVQAGDASAREALFAAAYPELQRLARARLRDGGRNTLLDTRDLVHESYLRYVRGGEPNSLFTAPQLPRRPASKPSNANRRVLLPPRVRIAGFRYVAPRRC